MSASIKRRERRGREVALTAPMRSPACPPPPNPPGRRAQQVTRGLALFSEPLILAGGAFRREDVAIPGDAIGRLVGAGGRTLERLCEATVRAARLSERERRANGRSARVVFLCSLALSRSLALSKIARANANRPAPQRPSRASPHRARLTLLRPHSRA